MSKHVALLVAEAPWFSFKNNHDQASCLPFFEGVKKLVNDGTNKPQLNIYHCNYYDDKSLESALDHLVNTREEIQILYIGGHGDGKHVADAKIKSASRFIRSRGKKLKGLIVSSCMAGLKDDLASATEWGFDDNSLSVMWVNGPNWVISYKYSVDWFQSALLETAIIKEFTESYRTEGRINSKSSILECFKRALVPFSLYQDFATCENGQPKQLGETLRIWVRAQGATYATDVTEELLEGFDYYLDNETS